MSLSLASSLWNLYISFSTNLRSWQYRECRELRAVCDATIGILDLDNSSKGNEPDIPGKLLLTATRNFQTFYPRSLGTLPIDNNHGIQRRSRVNSRSTAARMAPKSAEQLKRQRTRHPWKALAQCYPKLPNFLPTDPRNLAHRQQWNLVTWSGENTERGC